MLDFLYNKPGKIYGALTFVAVLGFVALKIPDLRLPYFWDELGVYSRAALYLADHHLGVLPDSLPPVWSRGHPLLCSFIFGLGFVIGGKSVITGHIVALLITCFLLVAVYRNVSSFYNGLIGLCAVILLCSQPVFFAQSVFVLPEMMLSLFSFLALCSYYKKQLLWFALYGSLAIMTKESAIVVPFVVLAYGFLQSFVVGRDTEYLKFRSIGLTLFPLFLFGVFLCIQKVQNGWYFFPYHTEFISFNMQDILKKNKDCQEFLFFDQGRYWWVKVFILGAVFGLLRAKLQPKNSFALLAVIFIIGSITFGSINFYMDRYTLSIFPFLTTLVVVCLHTVCVNRFWMIFSTLLLAVLCTHDLQTDKFNYDCDMSYIHHLNVEQRVIEKVCELSNYQSNVSSNFPLIYAFGEPNTGFVVCDNLNYGKQGNFKKEYFAATYEAGVPSPPEGSKLIFHINDSFADGVLYEKTLAVTDN